MCVTAIMFALIRSEICDVALEETIKTGLTSEVIKELYILSCKHDVAHIVASALSKAKLLGEDEVSDAFKNVLMGAVYRDAQREFALTHMTALLENANIPHILLKGSIICKYYPETWMRTSCDIDILISKKDTESAIEVLCKAGYIRTEDRSTHDYNFLSPNKVHIELHYTLAQGGRFSFSNKILDSVWESYVTKADGYNYRYSMIPEVFVIYHMAHMARHLVHGGCGVRPLIDLWLINKYIIIDDEKLYSLLNQTKLLKLYKASCELSTVWLESWKHNENTKHLEEFILNGGVYGTTSNAAKVKSARGISKVRSFLGLMFLQKENLEVLYPKLKNYPILYPFYQAKRWFRVFNKKKRNRIKHLTEQRNMVTTDEMNETAELLNQLGLI